MHISGTAPPTAFKFIKNSMMDISCLTILKKMRNKLAFQCLDADMLNLMKCYTDSLNTAGQSEIVAVFETHKCHCCIIYGFKAN